MGNNKYLVLTWVAFYEDPLCLSIVRNESWAIENVVQYIGFQGQNKLKLIVNICIIFLAFVGHFWLVFNIITTILIKTC